MQKKIKLALFTTILINLNSISVQAAEDIKYNGETGFMIESISNNNTSLLKSDSTKLGGFVKIEAEKKISNNTTAKFSLAGIESFNHKYNIEGTNKTDGVIDEGYIKYKNNKTIFTIGRKKLDTPLLYSYDFRPIINSYDLIDIANNSLKNTYLYAGVIFRSNNTEDLNFKAIDIANNTKTSPIYNIGGLFKQVELFPVEIWAYYQEKGMQSFYAETTSKFTKDLNLKLQYTFSDNQGLTNGKAVDSMGASVLYNINKYWNTEISINRVGTGDIENIASNISNKHTSKLYTSLVTTGEYMKRDEASLTDTSSFAIKAHGQLANNSGNLNLAFASYHHNSGTYYNNKNNTTYAGELNWNKEYGEHIKVDFNIGLISYQELDTSLKNKRNNDIETTLKLTYLF